MHEPAPAVEYAPLEQLIHIFDTEEPVLNKNNPATQLIQLDAALLTWYIPAEHAVQIFAPVVAKYPATQEVQLEPPEVER